MDRIGYYIAVAILAGLAAGLLPFALLFVLPGLVVDGLVTWGLRILDHRPTSGRRGGVK